MKAHLAAQGGGRLDLQAVARQDGEFDQPDKFADVLPTVQPSQLIGAEDPDEPSLRMLPDEFPRGVDGPAGAGTERLTRIDHRPGGVRESQAGHGDPVGHRGARRPVTQRRLPGGKHDHLSQPELPPRGGGGGHVPDVGRVEGPSEDAEHGGHAGITPTPAATGNPKQA